jgi:hypothetical protein
MEKIRKRIAEMLEKYVRIKRLGGKSIKTTK